MGKKIWTTLMIERLTDLYARGYSKQLIADDLDVTKNAVVGKISRLHRPKPLVPKIARKPRLKGAPEQKRMKRVVTNTSDYRAPIIKAGPPRPLTLMELEHHSCRWPMWGHDAPPFSEKLFCGAYAPGLAEAAPYCKAHTKKSIRSW